MGGQKPYFPMFVDISEKKIVVIGGGKIAERRVDTLLKFADDITVIAPEVTEEIRKRAEEGKVLWITESFSGSPDESFADAKLLLKDADIVLAATNDSACNERIMCICRERGILVNASHKKELCDFYFPAVIVRDHVTIGISSGGLEPKQTRKVRERIEAAL